MSNSEFPGPKLPPPKETKLSKLGPRKNSLNDIESHWRVTPSGESRTFLSKMLAQFDDTLMILRPLLRKLDLSPQLQYYKKLYPL